MSHLQQQVTLGLFLRVETLAGMTCIPADLVGVDEPFDEVLLGCDTSTAPVDGDMIDRMEPYLDPSTEIVSVECVRGWFARLSAPGYMDCTDWSGPFPSEAAALAHLEEMYGED